MISIVQTDDNVHYGVNSYVADTEEDVKSLPTTCKMGSTAFIIETSSMYMLNSKGEWKKI